MATRQRTWSSIVSVQPAREPVITDEAKRNADVENDYHDRDFKRWIANARKQVEHDARRSLITQTRQLVLDCFPSGDVIELPYGPIQSVSSVTYINNSGSSDTFSSSNYVLDTGREHIHLAYGQDWPSYRSQRNAVTVTYVAGYGDTAADVPEAAIDAMLLLIANRYENNFPVAERKSYFAKLGYDSLIQQIHPMTYP